jgi:hypothetical protein
MESVLERGALDVVELNDSGKFGSATRVKQVQSQGDTSSTPAAELRGHLAPRHVCSGNRLAMRSKFTYIWHGTLRTSPRRQRWHMVTEDYCRT